jgi:general secretion pathway protein G
MKTIMLDNNVRTSRGFTIVELLIVIVVLGILAALVLNTYSGAQERAKITQAKSDMATIKRAMLAYKAEEGELPPAGDSWNYNTNPPSAYGWTTTLNALQASGKLGSDRPDKDPWGNYYGYDDNDCVASSSPTAASYIRSVGPDGVTYTGDDITLLVSAGCIYS